MDVPWDSGEVPMDPLNETRLGFVDVEPPGSTARSRWGAIVIQKGGNHSARAGELPCIGRQEVLGPVDRGGEKGVKRGHC